MSKLSISEAHRATGKARSTIERHIADGTISAEKNEAGRAFIDVSELQRVYGEVNPAAIKKAKQKPAALQDATTENDAELQLLRVKLEYTERERDEAQRREREQASQYQGERDRLLGIIETQTKQIAALGPPTEPSAAQPPEKRGFWKRVFG